VATLHVSACTCKLENDPNKFPSLDRLQHTTCRSLGSLGAFAQHDRVLRCCAVRQRQQGSSSNIIMARYSKAYRSRDEGTTSVARVYADINDKRPQEYWDYENLQVQVGPATLIRGHHQQQPGVHGMFELKPGGVCTTVGRAGQLRGCSQSRQGQVQ